MLVGHGMELDTFERRDLATTATMSYENKEKADAITKQTNWQMVNTNVSKVQIN